MRCFFSIALSLLCVSASLPPFLTASHSPFLFLSAARSFGAPPSHLSSLLPSPLFHSSVSPPCLYSPLPSLSVSPSISSTLNCCYLFVSLLPNPIFLFFSLSTSSFCFSFVSLLPLILSPLLHCSVPSFFRSLLSFLHHSPLIPLSTPSL